MNLETYTSSAGLPPCLTPESTIHIVAIVNGSPWSCALHKWCAQDTAYRQPHFRASEAPHTQPV